VSETFAELQALLETASAEKAEMQLRIHRGELIEVAQLKRHVVERGHGTRDLLLYAPARHGAALAAAHRLNPLTVLPVLSSTMRAALTAISREGPPALSAAKPPPDVRM
jgi:hypothetical protein